MTFVRKKRFWPVFIAFFAPQGGKPAGKMYFCRENHTK